MTQFAIPCSVYRGGTSRGLFFLEQDLPSDPDERDRAFLTAIDSYNPSQVNGLGGTTSSTSKVCVLARSTRPDADVDWTFYQLGVGKPVVDSKGTCGNLMAGVGAFAVDAGLVPAHDGVVTIRVYNVNIDRVVCMDVPVSRGQAKVGGDFAISGVLGTGALIPVSIMDPGGGMTGSQFSCGLTSVITVQAKPCTVTFSDCINPFVFALASDFGLDGTEPLRDVAADADLLETLNAARDRMAVECGIAEDMEDARERRPNVPKIALVAPPKTYLTTDGRTVREDEVDVLIKVVSSGKFHRTSPASGLYNLAGTCLLPGTVPNAVAGFSGQVTKKKVRIGHPEGVVEVLAVLGPDGNVASVGMERTARRIMKGEIYVPNDARAMA